MAETNNQQETQAQQNPNPTPENNPTGEEVTVESLMALLAQERANNAKLKSDNDKLCTSEGNLRKQLRAKQTAEEQELEAKAEQQAQHDAYVKELEQFKLITEASNRYLSMGMSAELAKETATAEVEGDMSRVTATMTKFMADRDKAKEDELKAFYMSQMPSPQSGNISQVDYKQQFNEAISVGDSQAAALAILNESQALGQL